MRNPPTIDYGRPEPQEETNRLLLVLLLLMVGALLALIILPMTVRPHVKTAEEMCATNLREIGQGISLYAQDNSGNLPPDLQTVFTTQPISTDVATCPGTSDTRSPTPSGISQSGCCSYVYFGAGLVGQPDPSCVIAIEDPANHKLEGCNVLYGDGHVDWVDLPMAMQTLNDLATGKNPPSSQTTLTQSAAEKDYEKNWRARMPQLKMGVWHLPTTLPAALFRIEQ